MPASHPTGHVKSRSLAALGAGCSDGLSGTVGLEEGGMTEVLMAPRVEALLAELDGLDGRDDPYPRYDELRSLAPVAVAPDGVLVLTRYADCSAVVRERQFAHLPPDRMGEVFGPDWEQHIGLRQMFTSLLALNPPDHTRLRRLVSGAFTSRRVQELRPAITALVDDLLTAMADGEDSEIDFINAFAFPLPVNVIGELLGIPASDRAAFQPLVRDATQVLEVITADALERADSAAAQIRAYLSELVAERRRRPGADLLTALVVAEDAGDRLNEDELLSTAALLFAAGFETTTNLLGNGLVALTAHPDQLARLRANPTLAEPAVEELLRYDSPVQIVSRLTIGEVELGGLLLPAGSRVAAYIGAANRDPARFADPHRLDLTRRDNAPLSFGGGIHYCLGAALARLEAQIAFPALLNRFPRIALTDRPERRNSLTLHGFTRIPVRVDG
jgi:cytochrome P450